MVAGLLTAALARRLYLQTETHAEALCQERSFRDGSKSLQWNTGARSGACQGEIMEMGTLRGVPVVPVLTDFDPEVDWLDILYEPSECPNAGITATQSNGSLTVEVNGMAVAHLAGLSQKDQPAIRLVPLR